MHLQFVSPRYVEQNLRLFFQNSLEQTLQFS